MNKNHDTLLIFGLNPIETNLKADASNVLEIIVQQKLAKTNRRVFNLVELAKNLAVKVSFLENQEFLALEKSLKLEQKVNHQGVFAYIRQKSYSLKNLEALDLTTHPIIFALDQVQDPHNLGAVLRSADFFGVAAVIVPKHQSAVRTPVVSRVASGSQVPLVVVTNLSQALESLKKVGFWLAGLDLNAKNNLKLCDFKRPLIFVLGNEATGLRSLTSKVLDESYIIPQQGVVDSLNVATTAALCMYQKSLN